MRIVSMLNTLMDFFHIGKGTFQNSNNMSSQFINFFAIIEDTCVSKRTLLISEILLCDYSKEINLCL